MKKLYMQPCVEATQLQLSSMVLNVSPGAGISAGTGSGTTGDIGGASTVPIPGE